MKRFNQILKDQNYQNYITRLQAMEQDRVFCKHDMTHFLDVARIAYIIAGRENLPYNREIIYTTAILHDIGRVDALPAESHGEVSARLALEILPKYDYNEEEIELITEGIRTHNNREYFETDGFKTDCFGKECFETGYANSNSAVLNFQRLIYRADKLSRLCFMCPAQADCYWSDEDKNKECHF